MSAFEFERVCKTYTGPAGKRVEALRDLSLCCQAKEFLALLGSSGSGKTTLLRLVAGLEKPDSGRITIEDRPAADMAPENRDVAMVFQHPALYPHLTVEANVRLGLQIRHFPKVEIQRRVGEAIELLDIGKLADRKPATLSAGQMQRVSLARAMARRPRLLLLDEPLANLDGPARSELKAKIRELHRATGTTTVLVTHDQSEAFSLGHRIAMIDAGRVLQVAPPVDLFLKPETLAVARFLARPQLNLFLGTVASTGRESRFEVKPAPGFSSLNFNLPQSVCEALSPHAGKPLHLALRPENIQCCLEGQGSPPGLIDIEAPLERVEALGGWLDLHFQMAGHEMVVRTLHRHAPVGARFRLAPDMERAIFFDAATGGRVG